ncbi:MAG: hypothetical protein RL662_702, partial [Bacteroidota bacterium]
LCNLSIILEEVVGKETVDRMVPPLINDIMTDFLQKDKGIILENVGLDGSFSDSYEGRLINPGHGNESMLFFMDIKGAPVQQLEWDQKLWWVHLESMISFAKAYKLTGNPTSKEWFLKLHNYTWNRFRDAEHGGEWFGYLTRQGQPLLMSKGGKWKGCFHVPRALFQLWKTLEI